MKKIKNKNNKKILFIIIIFLIVFSYFEINGDIRVGIILNDILYAPSRFVKQEDIYTSINNEIMEENKELKSLLNIDNSLSEFTRINATIIERDNSFWLNEFTINKGIIDGIQKKDPVISENGLIGEVSYVSLNTSKIKLITDNDFKISVSINKNNKILSVKDNNIIIRGINETDDIKVGNNVITSGLQEKYPKGIIIGNIKNIIYENNYIGKIAEVELSSNINDLRFVTVLQRKIK